MTHRNREADYGRYDSQYPQRQDEESGRGRARSFGDEERDYRQRGIRRFQDQDPGQRSGYGYDPQTGRGREGDYSREDRYYSRQDDRYYGRQDDDTSRYAGYDPDSMREFGGRQDPAATDRWGGGESRDFQWGWESGQRRGQSYSQPSAWDRTGDVQRGRPGRQYDSRDEESFRGYSSYRPATAEDRVWQGDVRNRQGMGSGDSEWRPFPSGSQRGQYFGRGPRGYKRSDERITEDVNQKLMDDADIDASDIEVKVKDGDVTLTGSVANRQARRQVEDLVESVSGVQDVSNQLKCRKCDESKGNGTQSPTVSAQVNSGKSGSTASRTNAGAAS